MNAYPSSSQDWRDSALCAHTDPALWHPDKGGSNTAQTAKAICAQCPVQPQCLDHALKNYEAGIWGGKTEYERRLIRNTRTPGVPRPKTVTGKQLSRFAQAMREWRWVNGLTQDGAARVYGISQAMVADYETGRHAPTPEVRARINHTIRGTP